MKRINTQIRIVVTLRKGVEDQGCDNLGIKGCLCNVVFFFFFLMRSHEDTVCSVLFSISFGTAELFFKLCFSLTFNFEIQVHRKLQTWFRGVPSVSSGGYMLPDYIVQYKKKKTETDTRTRVTVLHQFATCVNSCNHQLQSSSFLPLPL